MPELRKMRVSFTKKVAQDIFNILTPSSATGRAATYAKEDSSKITKEDSVSEIPFFVGVRSRSNLDEIASFNRIPSDRAQDAIVYFVEEILRLKELKANVQVSTKKKKSTVSDPTRDEDEEVFQRQYILTADENGILHRLTISHTFLKIEERSFRPSATKTKKTKKPVYQLCWKPLRATKVLGKFELVSYPIETIMYNSRTNSIDRIPFKDDSLDRWTNAIEIGKSNLISMALDLRNTCYLVLFDGQEPYQALLESDILKYFKVVSDLIFNKTKLDPFGFRKSGEEIEIRKYAQPQKEYQAIENNEIEDDIESEFPIKIKGSPFGESFVFTKAEFLPNLIGNVLSPVFRIDIVDEKSVNDLLFNSPKNATEISNQKKLFRSLSDVALKNPLPTIEDATKPFRSLWFLTGSCNFKITYQSVENQFDKEKTKIQKLTPEISVGSRTKPHTKTFKIENEFVLHLKFLEKNSVAFVLGPSAASSKLKDFVLGDVAALAKNPNIDTQGLVLVGMISYGEQIDQIDPSKLSLEIVKIWCAETSKDANGSISKQILYEYGLMYFEFLCNFAKLYAMPKQKSYLYMDLAIKESNNANNSNLLPKDLNYLLDSVLFVEPEQIMIGDTSSYIRQQLSFNTFQKSQVSETPKQISDRIPKTKPILIFNSRPKIVENYKVINILDPNNLIINEDYPRGLEQEILLPKSNITRNKIIEYLNTENYVQDLAKVSATNLYHIDTKSLVPIVILWDGDYIVMGNAISTLVLQYMYANENVYEQQCTDYWSEIVGQNIPLYDLSIQTKGYKQPMLVQVIDLQDVGDLTPSEQQDLLNPYLKQIAKGVVPPKTAKIDSSKNQDISQPPKTPSVQEEIDDLLQGNSVQNKKKKILPKE